VWFPPFAASSSSVVRDRGLHGLDAMRLVAGALALTLFASFARAEGTANPVPTRPSPGVAHGKVPLRVVRVMPESGQALLFDRSRSTHVLVEVGGKIDGYTVEDIDDDEVTLQFQGKQIVLAAPARGSERRTDRPPAAVRSRSAADARPADARPGDARPGDTAAGDPTPVDPYGEPAVRVVEAPGAAGEPGPASEHPPAGASAALEAGEGAIRVIQAPSSSENLSDSAADPREVPAGARPIEPGDDGVRVAEARGEAAPSASAAPPADPPPGIRVAQAPRAARPASARATRPSEAPVTDARPPAPSGEPIRVVEAPAAARDPSDQRTLSARAMADVLTGGSGAHDGRKPRSSLFTPAPAAPSEPPAQASATAEARPASAASPTAAPVVAHADGRPASAGAPAAPGDAVTLSRVEVDAALADFARLTAAIHGSFSAAGVVVDAVRDRTLFQRAGLRAGDVIAAVDGIRLRSLDDAANLYARASKATAITAQIVRSGKPMTLHVVIR
jgi:hypothetical protein